MDGAYITIPFDVEKIYGTKGRLKVKATFEGHPYRGSLANMGTGHILIVRKDIRAAIEKKAGDKIQVTLEPDTEPREVIVPEDLAGAFRKSAKAKSFFEKLSYTNKKEYAVWITSAKKPETRERRVQDTIKKLLKGMKNPSQKE